MENKLEEKKIAVPTEQPTPELEVEADVFFNMQINNFEAMAADAEIEIAEAELKLAKIKRQKIQTIIDFNLDQIKRKQAPKEQTEKAKEPEIAKPKTENDTTKES